MKKVKCTTNCKPFYWLTLSNIYEVLGEPTGCYTVINDNGYTNSYPCHLFDEIEDKKEDKLPLIPSLISLLTNTTNHINKLIINERYKDAESLMGIALMAQELLEKHQ